MSGHLPRGGWTKERTTWLRCHVCHEANGIILLLVVIRMVRDGTRRIDGGGSESLGERWYCRCLPRQWNGQLRGSVTPEKQLGDRQTTPGAQLHSEGLKNIVRISSIDLEVHWELDRDDLWRLKVGIADQQRRFYVHVSRWP